MAIRKVKNKKLVIVGVVAVVGLGGFLAWRWHAAKSVDPYYPKATETAKSPGGTATPTASPTAGSGTSLNPGHTDIPTTTAAQSNAAGTITITSPTQGSTVSSGTVVTGQANVGGATLHFRLKGGKSGQLASGEAKAASASGTSAYSFTLAFTNQVSDPPDQGVLEVYTISPTDGSETGLASVTVNIQE